MYHKAASRRRQVVLETQLRILCAQSIHSRVPEVRMKKNGLPIEFQRRTLEWESTYRTAGQMLTHWKEITRTVSLQTTMNILGQEKVGCFHVVLE